ncbi:hypothetical protein [uncultured Kordia sp.]|uniref:hypothetical protein n=1 Tax=uncultured Kordia sp. TaxID=507699 RepID=UPI0026377355|nr:hypothetical protein [uncultured Kordia sp.]
MGINNEKQYINGVNHAYILAQHQPTLLKQLLESKTQNDYFIGLQDGQRMYEQSRSKSRLQQLNKIKGNKAKDKDQER